MGRPISGDGTFRSLFNGSRTTWSVRQPGWQQWQQWQQWQRIVSNVLDEPEWADKVSQREPGRMRSGEG